MPKFFFLALLVLAPAASAASLTGIWVGRITLREGVEQDIAFQFEQRGERLTGKLYGDFGSTRIAEGKVTGDTLWFVVLTAEQAGNQIHTTRFRFEGKLAGETLALIRRREASASAGNAGAVQAKNDAGQAITLKRLW
jgi:hypothetical protein